MLTAEYSQSNFCTAVIHAQKNIYAEIRLFAEKIILFSNIQISEALFKNRKVVRWYKTYVYKAGQIITGLSIYHNTDYVKIIHYLSSLYISGL